MILIHLQFQWHQVVLLYWETLPVIIVIFEVNMHFLPVQVTDQSLMKGLDLRERGHIWNKLRFILTWFPLMIIDHIDLIQFTSDIDLDRLVCF